MATGQFTREDAQAILALVQEAPLRNMRMASEVSALLQRFSAFVDHNLDANKPCAEEGEPS